MVKPKYNVQFSKGYYLLCIQDQILLLVVKSVIRIVIVIAS